jgi:adenine phosphoribosyltransferase
VAQADLNEVRTRLRALFAWRGDRDSRDRADVTGWWRDGWLLRELGPALAAVVPSGPVPTVVVGPDSRGSLVGPLVAVHLGIGFVEIRKNRTPAADSDAWVRRTTPPDYHDRHLELGFRRSLLSSSDRVLMTDDWVDTGSQALTVLQMIDDVGATWLGFACIVDALDDSRIRRRLALRSLLHVREL